MDIPRWWSDREFSDSNREQSALMKNNPWISLAILSAVTFLAACGGPQGLIGGGSTGSSLLSVTISPSNPTLALSVSPAPPTTTQFVATGTYSFGNPQDISKQVAWSPTDPKVVTIDGNGVATAVGSGRAYVSAQIQDPVTGKLFTPNTILAVVPQLTAIMVTPASATIAHGTSQQFTATGKFNDNSSVDITSQVAWISSQPGFAIISGSPGTQGLTNGVAAGTVNITAQLGTLVSSPSVLTVSNANLVGLAANPGTATVPLATVQQLAAMGSFDDGTQQDISGDVVWSSSASATARISQTGAVAGTGIGSAAVTATFGSQEGSALITVDASSVNAVNVLPVTTIATGTHRQMRAIGAFADGGSLEVTNTPGITRS